MKTLIANLQKYYGVYLLIVAVLFLILWFPNRAVNRYAISGDTDNMVVWIVDTRTGQTWWKRGDGVIDLGTTNKPIFEGIITKRVKPVGHNFGRWQSELSDPNN
jgi:hypothetical protein